MSGWKKLEVKDLDLDIEGPGKSSEHSKTDANIEAHYDFDALRSKAHDKASTNPLELWAAYRNFRERKPRMPQDEIPEWILEYFDKVANQLLNAKPGGDVRKLCQSALMITKKEIRRLDKSKPDKSKHDKSKHKKPKRRKKGL